MLIRTMNQLEAEGRVISHLISVFNPPLTGRERHDEGGAYPPTGPIPPGPARA